MLANNEYNNIPIGDYYQEILQIFVLAFGVFVTLPWTLVYLEVIANIQCYLFTCK